MRYWDCVLSFTKLGEAYSFPPSCIFLLCGTKMARYRPNLFAFHTPASPPASLLISPLRGVTWTNGELSPGVSVPI